MFTQFSDFCGVCCSQAVANFDQEMDSIIPRESLDFFDTVMSPIDPMLYYRPLDPGRMLRNPSETLDKPGNSSETRSSHHYFQIDISWQLSKFLRHVESVASDASAKV